jgi:hypothetical protein
MPHVLPRVTIAEISADPNVCKIVYENNFNLLNVAFTGASRAEAEKSRLQRVRQIQALEASNLCNLKAAQNAKRDLDECKGGAERAEEDVKNLKNEWRGFKAVLAGGWSQISGFSEHRTRHVTCSRMKGLTLVGEWLRLVPH